MSGMRKNHHSQLAPVVSAARRGDLEALTRAIAVGDELAAADSDGRTALHHAAITGDDRCAALLLAAGADVNAVDSAGWTPLHFAASGYHVSVAKALLDAGASVDAEDGHGNTPLSNATFESRGKGEMIRLLVQRGADKHHANRHGVSPLKLAETIANYDVAQWLR